MKLCYKPVGGAGVYLFYPGEKTGHPGNVLASPFFWIKFLRSESTFS